jgi:hypothetical protein
LLPTPKKNSSPETTKHKEACSEEPDSKTDTDDRHHYQAQDLPLTAAGHESLGSHPIKSKEYWAQVLIYAETVHVGTGPNFSDLATYQGLREVEIISARRL